MNSRYLFKIDREFLSQGAFSARFFTLSWITLSDIKEAFLTSKSGLLYTFISSCSFWQNITFSWSDLWANFPRIVLEVNFMWATKLGLYRNFSGVISRVSPHVWDISFISSRTNFRFFSREKSLCCNFIVWSSWKKSLNNAFCSVYIQASKSWTL